MFFSWPLVFSKKTNNLLSEVDLNDECPSKYNDFVYVRSFTYIQDKHNSFGFRGFLFYTHFGSKAKEYNNQE